MRVIIVFTLMFSLLVSCQNDAKQKNPAAAAATAEQSLSPGRTEAQIKEFVISVTRTYEHWQTANGYMKLVANENPLKVSKTDIQNVVANHTTYENELLALGDETNLFYENWQKTAKQYNELKAKSATGKLEEPEEKALAALETDIKSAERQLSDLKAKLSAIEKRIAETKVKFDELTIAKVK